MKRKFYTIFAIRTAAALIAAALVVSCNIDDSYDLDNINTDNIGIGTDETSFEMPLVKVTISADDALTTKASDQSEDESEYEIESEATALTDLDKLNALLPGREIDLSLVESDPEYAAEVTEDLLAELQNDAEKCAEFCAEVNSNEEYAQIKAQIESDLGDGILDDPDDFYTQINDESNDLSSIKDVVTSNLQTQVAEKTKATIEVGAIEIGEEVLDILNNNIDGNNNTLRLKAIYEHNLDLTIDFGATLIFNEGLNSLEIPSYDEVLESGSLHGLIGTGEILEKILENLTVDVNFDIKDYDSSKGLETTGKSIKVTLIAIKNGSIKL